LIARRNMKLSIADYIKELESVVCTEETEGSIMQIVDLIKELKKNGKRLWVLGNGGSLAIAQHFAQDLLKMYGVRAQALNCPSVITAYANDNGFQDAQASALGILRDQGDVIVIFSCSGSSRNYIDIVTGGEMKPIIGIVGTDGGFIKEHADICVHVKSDNYATCETAFSLIADLISFELEEIEHYAKN